MESLNLVETSENATNNDVLNDKTNAVPKAKVTAASILFDLEEQRIKWQEGAYRKSNEELYMILASCLQYAGDLDFFASKERTNALQMLYKERGYQWRKETPLITKVVRAVFGDTDRRRISTYSLVLRQAKKEKVAFTGLIKWIEDEGGLQKIRLSKSPTFIKPKQKVEFAQQDFASLSNLAVVKTEALSLQADADFVGEDCVLLAQQQADGSFAIRAVLRNGTAVNAAFTALYSNQKASKEEANKNAQAANDADGALRKAA